MKSRSVTVAFLIAITLSAASPSVVLGQVAPIDEAAVETVRDALRKEADFPWYDAQADQLARTEVQNAATSHPRQRNGKKRLKESESSSAAELELFTPAIFSRDCSVSRLGPFWPSSSSSESTLEFEPC